MKKFFLIPAALVSMLAFGCSEYLCLVPAGTTASTKLSVCHIKGNGKYELLSVKASAAQAHADHGDFLAPAGAKKNSDCVPPVVVPPVVVPPTGTPTTNPPTVPPVVVPPVVVPPIVVPPVVDTIVEGIKEIPEEIKDLPCMVDPWQPQCQL